MGWDFRLGDALGAMIKTGPFIILRMIVYFGIAVLYLISVGVGGAIGYGFTSFGDGEGGGAIFGALIGFAGASGVLYWAREYLLYLVKAGHIAVLTQIFDGQTIPGGQGQISYATDVVKERFAEASALFALDQLIKGVLRFLTGTLNTVAAILPIPGLRNLVGIINAVVRMSLTYVDEIILAHNIRVASDNPWDTSCDALVLYAQNIKIMIRNAVWLTLMMWALTFIIFLLLLGPVLGFMALFPGNAGFVAFVVAFIFAWAFKAALVEPLAIFALMQVYFKTIEGQQPDAEWRTRLENTSQKFQEMAHKAANFVADKPAPASAASDPGEN